MTPPWPDKAFNFERNAHVRHVAFSPSGSQLAFCIFNSNTAQNIFHIWDRWGKETLLEGHTEYIHCLEYSLDGEYLASGSADGSIRIWHTDSFHCASSNPDIERGTRTPKQADKSLVVTRSAISLSFSRTDSNLLASGSGEINVWNLLASGPGRSNGEINMWIQQACIHTLYLGRGPIRTLFFAGGADSACIALTNAMSIIRIWRAEGSSDLASEIIGEADPGDREGNAPSVVFSPNGSFLATSFYSRSRNESTVALYDLETMTKNQHVVMSGFEAKCVAVSPDSKQLVVGGEDASILLIQTDDFSIQRALEVSATHVLPSVLSVAFDPTCRFLAVGSQNGRLEIRSL
jgi:WD40 repeat protein